MKTKLLFLTTSLFTLFWGNAQLVCDDFTNSENWPENSYSETDTVGYSQEGTFPIIMGTEAFSWVNGFEEGIYGVGSVNFEFDGTNQIAQFTIYGFEGQFGEMGFNVNGSADAFMDDTFPMTLGGVTIDLEIIGTVDDWTYTHITFTGEIDEITIITFESGVTELCVEPVAVEAEGCDDFTIVANWPEMTHSSGDTIGYLQDGAFPIIMGADAFSWVNGFEEGIYGVGSVNFEFDGTNQIAQFTIYGFEGQFDQMGFNVNGSADAFMDGTFPMTLGGVTIDLEIIGTVDDWTYTHVTFTGEIDEITIITFESGITELCVEENEPTGLSEQINHPFESYPNPVQSDLFISSENIIQSAAIYALSGELILNKNVQSTQQQIDLSFINHGLYVLVLSFEDGSTSTQKLVIE